MNSFYFPLIAINIIIALFISAIEPYDYVAVHWFSDWLFWFLSVHFGYVLNHLGSILIKAMMVKVYSIQVSKISYVQTLFISFITALMTSFPLSLMISWLYTGLISDTIDWQQMYFNCLLWNFFMMFSYGLWLQKNVFDVSEITLTFPLFFSILLGSVNLWKLVNSSSKLTHEQSHDKPNNTLPKELKKQLPLELQSSDEVISLQSDDHYLHIKTNQGKAHIRLRLRDAIAMIEDVSSTLEKDLGMQVHRSYWVNFRYVKEVRTKEILLKNGDKVPLSKNKKTIFLAALEENL